MEFQCPPDPLQEILRPFPAFFGRSFLRSRTQLEVSLRCSRGQVRPFHFNFVRGIYIRNPCSQMAGSVFQQPPPHSLLRDCRNPWSILGGESRWEIINGKLLYNMIRHFSGEPLRDTVDILHCSTRIRRVICRLCGNVPFTFRPWGEYRRSGWGLKAGIENIPSSS